MSWTKGQLVTKAYGELALAGYEFDISPDEMQAGCETLDLMIATWAAQGLVLPYAMAGTPGATDSATDSGLPLIAVEAAYMALAIRIAASKGKLLLPTTSKVAKQAYDALLSAVVSNQVDQQQFRSGTPRGAGSKPWRNTMNPYTTQPDTSALQNSAAGGLDISNLGA